jgi:hypothetical protein
MSHSGLVGQQPRCPYDEVRLIGGHVAPQRLAGRFGKAAGE